MIFFAASLLVTETSAESSWWQKASEMISGDAPQTLNSSADIKLDEMTAAFKQSLQIASEEVVKQLGRVDGFNGDDAVHIPIPKELATVKSILEKLGLADVVDDLELKLNRAAELATPKAQTLFVEAIQALTFEDVEAIYNGADDAATKYFQGKMSASLSQEMSPIVKSSLAEVGAIQAYDKAIADYEEIPFVPDVKADLTNYVVEQGIAGIFYYMAQQEAAIRKDPAQQTTELLKKVFSNK